MHIKRVACIGVGLIGSSWATLYAAKGLDVILEDLTEEILDVAMSRIRLNLESLEAHALLDKGRAQTAFSKIKTTIQLAEAVEQADYITESVTEDYFIKKGVFQEMDSLVPDHVILASSSSGLLMTEIQKATSKPGRCVLAHPILPPHLIPLVEIAGGERTSAMAINATQDFMTRLGRVPIVLKKEVPGYIVNRLQAALWREAVSLVTNDVASALDVDRAFCYGIGLRDPILGPFLRAHIAGNGIQHFIDAYSQSYSNRWKTMETWTTMSSSAAKKVITSVRKMPVICAKTLDELTEQRDAKLIQILKSMAGHPFY